MYLTTRRARSLTASRIQRTRLGGFGLLALAAALLAIGLLLSVAAAGQPLFVAVATVILFAGITTVVLALVELRYARRVERRLLPEKFAR